MAEPCPPYCWALAPLFLPYSRTLSHPYRSSSSSGNSSRRSLLKHQQGHSRALKLVSSGSGGSSGTGTGAGDSAYAGDNTFAGFVLPTGSTGGYDLTSSAISNKSR